MLNHQLLQLAHVITWRSVTPDWIRQYGSNPKGAEALRQIVALRLEGADKITSVLPDL